ncbi:MAG: amidohydrolase family protein [Phycisphaerales bacterium]
MKRTGTFMTAAIACSISMTLAATIAAQPGSDDEVFVVVRAGTIITGDGKELAGGEIVIVDGKVRLVGRDLDYPRSATIIDARDQVVMPGMIHAYSRAGLPTYTRNGVHANYSVRDDVNLDVLDLNDLVEAGFTAVCLQPNGNGIPGTAAMYRTAGPDEERLLVNEVWLRTSMTNPGSDKAALRGAISKAHAEIAKIEKARKEWEEKQKKAAEAKANEAKPAEGGKKDEGGSGGDEPKKEEPAQEKKPEEEKFEPPATDPAVKPFMEIIQKESTLPLLMEVNDSSDILHAIDLLAEDDKVDLDVRLLLEDASGFRLADYAYIVDTLIEHKDDFDYILMPGVSQLPDTNVAFNLAGELAARGIKPAFVPRGDNRGILQQYRADVAVLVRCGMTRAQALDALLAQPARITGVSERMGTIAKDKDADLVFLDGDPLDPFSKVTRVMILGETVYEAEDATASSSKESR